MRRSVFMGVSLSLIAMPVTITGAGPQQVVTPPKARYYMDVSTQTGLPAGKMGVGSAMGMVFGGGKSKEYKSIGLYLGSTLDAGGSPKADHFMPSGAKLGKSVPLIGREREPGEEPAGFERPKGRLLIYWGCGAEVRKGQPIVIDFAKVAAGQMPPNFWSVRVPRDRQPSPANSRTYGDWPNTKSDKGVSSSASVLGDHKVASNYLPSDINFAVSQDFMSGVSLRTTSLMGATSLNWNAVPEATGYYAWTIGSDGREGGDIIWWSSSDSREFGGALTDFLSPSSVANLVRQNVVMAPAKTSCTIPAEVKKSAAFNMVMLYAYGPEQNVVFPERPADPKIAWNQQWSVKMRYRSMAFNFIGEGMQGADTQGRCKQSAPRGGGLIGGVLGAAIGGNKKDDTCK
jgi:hypothetical protein